MDLATSYGSISAGDGCKITYRFDGLSEGPILLLSNSLGTDMSMWTAQMEDFGSSFRVLRYDSRGHGASDAPAGAYSIDRLGRDVVELLDGLHIDTVDFCGLSLGGMVGQWLGIRAPERIRRLVLANTSGFMGPPSNWDARINTALRDGMATLAAASVERWFTPSFVERAEESIAPIRTMLVATNPGGYAGCCAAIRDMDMRWTAALIETPALVIGGRLDPAAPPAHAEALAEVVAGARLEMLDAAHLSNVEQPAPFARAVLDFLTQ